jgi:hypothetical protein
MIRTKLTGAAAALLLTLVGCASTGATFRSGVGDTFLERAPWYAGAAVSRAGTIAHVPIAFQHTSFTDPGAGGQTPVGALLGEMNAYLDSLRMTVRSGEPVVGTPPDVHFGCEVPPNDECESAAERMRLAVGRPSGSWIESASAAASRVGADRVLVVTLEIGNYLPRQRNFRGDKEIELGTGYSQRVPWLTALDAPANVLQLTGALMGRDGRAIRIGAEGLMARRTNAVLSGFGVQAMISDDDVERIRTARREDLPGQPLVWQVALRNLVAGLTGGAH